MRVLNQNSGLLRANEIMLNMFNEISKRILELSKEALYVIVDISGQLELFAFGELCSGIIPQLGVENNVGISIIDSFSI